MTTTLQVTGYTPDPLNPTTPHLVVPHFIGEPTPESLIRFTPWRIESGEKDGVRILLVRRDAFRSFGGLPYDRTRFLREAGVVAVLSESKNDFVPQVDVLLSQAITDETKKHLRAIVEDVLYPKKSFEEKTPALRPGNLPLADEDAEEDLWQGVKLRVVGCEPVHPDRATPRLVKPRFNTDDGAAHCLAFPAVRVKNRDVHLLAVRRHELKSLEGLPVSLTGGISPDPFDVLIFLAKDDAELSQVLASLILRARTASCTTRLREIRDAIPLTPDPAEKHLPKKDLGTPSREKRSVSAPPTAVSPGSQSTQDRGVNFPGREEANTSSPADLLAKRGLSLDEDIYVPKRPRSEPQSSPDTPEDAGYLQRTTFLREGASEDCHHCGKHISRHYGGTSYRCLPKEDGEDLAYFRKTMFDSLKVPEEYRRLGDNVNEGAKGPPPNKKYKIKAGSVRRVRPLPAGRLLRVLRSLDSSYPEWATQDPEGCSPREARALSATRDQVAQACEKLDVLLEEVYSAYEEGDHVTGLAQEDEARDWTEEELETFFQQDIRAKKAQDSKIPKIIGFYTPKGDDEALLLACPLYENSKIHEFWHPCFFPPVEASDTPDLILLVRRADFRDLPHDLTLGFNPLYAAYLVGSQSDLRATCTLLADCAVRGDAADFRKLVEASRHHGLQP